MIVVEDKEKNPIAWKRVMNGRVESDGFSSRRAMCRARLVVKTCIPRKSIGVKVKDRWKVFGRWDNYVMRQMWKD